jgi:hypothetical protein
MDLLKTLAFVGVMALTSFPALAQSSGSAAAARAPSQGTAAGGAGLATQTGHELNVSLGSYKYIEPDAPSISIHGVKFGGEYTGTLSLDRSRHWFVQADLRGTTGHVAYDGWCYPFLITPNSASPNGWQLDVGDASPCSESGDKDWYVETRGLVGKDLIGDNWALSPFTGLGFRHLSNGTSGVPGFRTDDYLYLPVGMTARTRVASRSALSITLEYDLLIHGWQTTRDSLLGGGDVPATAAAPAFTIESFTDVSFDQHRGWALRASAKYQVTKRWSVEPSYIYWNVGASPVSTQIATFTVNNVTVDEQFGAYEPRNVTHEFALKLGVRF